MARRLPPLNALRAFEASARLGSFVAAAAELHVSAAAVSQQVRRLERYLDTTLFQRLARGLVLTEEGRGYLPELSQGFDLLGESTARLRAKSADFRREDIDLAIRFAPAPGRGLHGEALCGEELFPVASPRLFGGGRTPDTLAALAAYPLLHDVDAHPEQPWMSWRGWFERAGLDGAAATRGMQFTDSVVLVGAAVAGLGVALGRGPQVAPLLARGQLVRLTQESWQAPWKYFLVAPAAHFRRPIVRAFVDWALQEARDETGSA